MRSPERGNFNDWPEISGEEYPLDHQTVTSTGTDEEVKTMTPDAEEGDN